jgi:hypothetical protein
MFFDSDYSMTRLPNSPLSFLSQDSLDAREIAADRFHLLGRLELAHRLLNAHPKQLIVQVVLFRREFVSAEIA